MSVSVPNRKRGRSQCLTFRSRPLPPVAGRCAIKLRAAPLTFNVRTLRPLWCSSLSRLFLAACWLCQSGSARRRLLLAPCLFWLVGSAFSVLLRSTGIFNEIQKPWSLGYFQLHGTFRLPPAVSATSSSFAPPLSRQTVLTLRSTPDAMKQPSFPQPSARGAG